MIVGTVSPEGQPSTRTVLLKDIHDGKFIFYTNYESRKGKQLAKNPHISLSFVWHPLERQVHIEGTAGKVPAHESDEYFKPRPYKRRIGARISPQSRPMDRERDRTSTGMGWICGYSHSDRILARQAQPFTRPLLIQSAKRRKLESRTPCPLIFLFFLVRHKKNM